MGKVVGSVVSTRKNENLVGNKFMIVEVADHMRQGAKPVSYTHLTLPTT